MAAVDLAAEVAMEEASELVADSVAAVASEGVSAVVVGALVVDMEGLPAEVSMLEHLLLPPTPSQTMPLPERKGAIPSMSAT